RSTPNIKLRWIFKDVDSNQVHLLSEALRLRSAIAPGDPQLAFTLAGLLAARGIADPEAAERFLFPSLSHLHSPYTMSGMQAAVDRLDAAIERKEGILIYGDYDVDGTTAIVILKTAMVLCGAGVAFKLAQALMERRLTQSDQSRLVASFMKIVAIATIADAVPLTGENRVFAKLGLEGLRAPVNAGLKALLEVAQLAAARPLNSGEVAFRIAPRLNAAGRMDVARDVIDLFSVKDAARAREIANRLDQLNSERQEEERRIMDAIQLRIEQEPALREAFCAVIDGDGWHRGVIGITATRVVERYG